MTNNPYLNALLGVGYIAAVASLTFWGPMFAGKEDTIMIPVMMLSLFVFSASMMAFLLLYRPLCLFFIDGKKQEALDFFLKTLGTLGAVVIILFAVNIWFT